MSESNGDRAPEELDSELLTAYLDGELSESETIAVERRLASDSGFRSQMQDMQNAWDMLDALPAVKPDVAFVRTTVEMAIAGRQRSGISAWGPRIIGALAMLGLPLTLFAVAFFATRESIEQPERELLGELPVIENYDRYSRVFSDNDPEQGIHFLNSIYERGLFSEVEELFPVDSEDETEEAVVDLVATTVPPSADMIQDRSDRLTSMTDQQREDLFAKKQKFEALPQETQTAIRDFHNLLSNDPDRDRLWESLVSYYDWLKTLRASQRTGLLDSPIEKRLGKIREITRLQAEQAFGRLGATKLPVEDAEAFYGWYDFAITCYNPEIRKRAGKVFSDIRSKKGLPILEDDVSRVMSGPIGQLVDFLMRQDRENFGQLIAAKANETQYGMRELENQLTRSSLLILDGLEVDEKRELVLRWIEVANKTRFPIQTTKLKAFYETLPVVTRDKLDNMHPDDWYESLTRLYWEAENIVKSAEPAEEEEFRRFLRENGLDSDFEIDDFDEAPY